MHQEMTDATGSGNDKSSGPSGFGSALKLDRTAEQVIKIQHLNYLLFKFQINKF